LFVSIGGIYIICYNQLKAEYMELRIKLLVCIYISISPTFPLSMENISINYGVLKERARNIQYGGPTTQLKK
jgi:hypothetical protein